MNKGVYAQGNRGNQRELNSTNLQTPNILTAQQIKALTLLKDSETHLHTYPLPELQKQKD